MKRFIGLIVSLSVLLVGQTMVIPLFLPFNYRPDLLLVTTVLMGFLRPNGQAVWVGLIFGCCQGLSHATAIFPFALSRSFAGMASSWLRVRWLWSSLPAAAFCVAVCTLIAEVLLGLLLSLTERSFSWLLFAWRIGFIEAIIGAVLGGILFRFLRRGEATK